MEVSAERSVLAAMPAGVSAVTWISGLARAEKLALKNSPDAARAEIWQFDVSPEWNVRFDGTRPCCHWKFESGSGRTNFIRELKNNWFWLSPVPRQRRAIRSPSMASIQKCNGQALHRYPLSVRYRSTQGRVGYVFKIPADARVTSVQADGVSVPLRPENGELAVALLPGVHQLSIEWQSNVGGARFAPRAPAIDLGTASSNIHTRLRATRRPMDSLRNGPGVGPQSSFWGELLVFIVIAVLLGRSQYSPLRTQEWLLLGLGLSTFSWGVLAHLWRGSLAMKWRSGWEATSVAVRSTGRRSASGCCPVIALIGPRAAIPFGLLSTPDMPLRGLGSGGNAF